MTGPEFRSIRKKLCLTQVQWGRALGFPGAGVRVTVANLERGKREITGPVARLAAMYDRYGVPE